MGFLFLSIALTAGIIKAYCGKKTSNYTENIKDAILANSLRMFFCVCIGFVLILVQGQLRHMKPDVCLLAVTAFSGLSTAVFVVTWLLSVKQGVYMMVEVFLMLGVLIPMTAGSVFFDETLQPSDWVGMAILIAATLIMCAYNHSQKGAFTTVSLILLVICGAASGLVDFSQKLFVRTMPEISVSIFNFYTYVFCAIFLAPPLFLCSRERRNTGLANSNRKISKISGYIFVMSVCLFANSYFKTKAAVYLDSAQLYPLNQGCALILSTLMAALLFKEKITLKCVAGIVLAFIGMLFINVL